MRFPGSYVYLDIAVQSVSFSIYVNGVQQDINSSNSNCSYNRYGPLRTGSFTNNITIYVFGALMSGRDVGSSDADWSFEFNKFLYVTCFLFWWYGTETFFAYSIGESSSATSAAASATATTGQFSNAGDNKPHIVMILSSLASVLLAAMFWA